VITVQEATRLVLENTISFEDEIIPLRTATGRVLREPLTADRDFPPFDRVTMDGIAINWTTFEKGQREFPVENLQAAGSPQLTLLNDNNCFEVMTGAILPAGVDTVIRYEDISIKEGKAIIHLEDVQRLQNIHPQGADRRKGNEIVKAGCKISPAEIGVAATVGKTMLKVARLPRIAIISTGDELVAVEEQPLPHQIRKSNAHTLAAALAGWGISADLKHLNDEPNQIRRFLRQWLAEYDTLLLSGGVSEGKFDFLPAALKELGVLQVFHKISQRPGKPFWFGKKPEGVAVFAFPGNPVSTFMCLLRYFQPWLRVGLGLPPFEPSYARLAEDFSFKPDLTYFLQVKIHFGDDGGLYATPVAGGGSGDLANLVAADGFLELPKERQAFAKGEVFPLIIFR
jgi:molybdopterin molybdotransferase